MAWFTAPVLTLCFVGFVVSPHDRILTPLSVVLAAAISMANIAGVGVETALFVDASLPPVMLAVAFLGPAPVFALLVLTELAAWPLTRARPVSMLINIASLTAPCMTGAALFLATSKSLEPGGLAWAALLASTAVVSLSANLVLVPRLVAASGGNGPRALDREAYRALLPIFAMEVVCAILTARVYQAMGLEALVFLFAVMIAFTYMIRLLARANRRAAEITELARSRRLLVADALLVEDRERRVLAEALHDDAVQALLAIRQDLTEVQQPQDAAAVQRAAEEIRGVIGRLREAIVELHPTALAQLGLGPALTKVANEQARRGAFRAHVAVDPDNGGDIDRLLFSLGREFLVNAAKHAHAKNVALTVQRYNGFMQMSVQDDGVGFEPGSQTTAIKTGHLGLASAAERVASVGGSMTIQAETGRGTDILVEVPHR